VVSFDFWFDGKDKNFMPEKMILNFKYRFRDIKIIGEKERFRHKSKP
jgi:hypothetical protein